MLLKKHKHPFLFTKDEMVQERVDDDTGDRSYLKKFP